LKSLMFDEPVVLSLTLPGWKEMVFRIRTRSNLEQRLLFRTLEQDEKDRPSATTTEWLQNLQYYAAAYQMLSAGPKQFSPPEHTGQTTPEMAQRDLREYVVANFLPLSAMKWHLITSALRLFEAKVNLASNELLSRDFSKPAG